MKTPIQTIPSAYTPTLQSFYARIYTWMVAGLLVSALFAYLTLHSQIGVLLFSNPAIFYGITAIELAILFGVQFLVKQLPTSMSQGLFFLYAALNGITLSGLMAIYTTASVFAIFLIAAGLFGTLAIIGFTTKKDLSGWGTFLFIGMLGVFVSSIVNMFLQNSFIDMIVSAVAILIFSGLTVYDNQIYKAIFAQNVHDNDTLTKQATIGALHMYINFIMIFVSLLKFFGVSRD